MRLAPRNANEIATLNKMEEKELDMALTTRTSGNKDKAHKHQQQLDAPASRQTWPTRSSCRMELPKVSQTWKTHSSKVKKPK